MFRYLIFGWLLLVLSACQSPTEPNDANQAETEDTTPTAPTFVDQLETAHAKAAFRNKDAIQFDLELTFGGRKRFEGTVTLSTDSGAGLMEENSGRKLYYLKDSIYYASDDERSPAGLRFSAYTWPYFFLLPYKLSDPGTNWTDYPQKTLNDNSYLAEKLTFDPGTGDAPDDWYIIYADTDTELVEVAAYIVTAGSSQAEAEEDPHAIQYGDYQLIDGVPIAHKWTFWAWRTTEGLTDELGSAILSNVRFVPVTEATFAPPSDYIAG